MSNKPKSSLPDDTDYIRKAVELAASRFWERVEIGASNDDCHVWVGYKNPKGYGRLYLDGKNIMAHRFAWILKNGAIPDGLIICHSCDNPSCVNWRHLWIGTHADNARDRDEKGRHNPHSKDQYRRMQTKQAKERRQFSDNDIREIRLSHASCRELARRYRCDHSLIWQIKQHRSYVNVE